MKNIIKILVLSFLLTSCNSPHVVFDYDAAVDFTQFRSYQLFPDFRTSLSQLDEKRLINSLSGAMQSKGFMISENKPDLYVNIYTEEFQEQNPNTLGVGLGSGGGNVGVGVSGGIPLGGPKNYVRFIIDFIAVEEDALVWKAEVETKFNKNASPEQRQALFDKIIAKALSEYPPKK